METYFKFKIISELAQNQGIRFTNGFEVSFLFVFFYSTVSFYCKNLHFSNWFKFKVSNVNHITLNLAILIYIYFKADHNGGLRHFKTNIQKFNIFNTVYLFVTLKFVGNTVHLMCKKLLPFSLLIYLTQTVHTF